MNYIELIKDYYEKRGLKWPSFSDALKWMQTEIAEVYELDLARTGGWVRNNPDDKEAFSSERLAEELGDAIMMLIVAGIVEGVDPLSALEKKIQKRLAVSAPKSDVESPNILQPVKSLTGYSQASFLTET